MFPILSRSMRWRLVGCALLAGAALALTFQ